MKQIKEEPILGREYLVYDGNNQQKSVKCLYLGKKPVKTEWFMKQEALEGHSFVRLNEKQELEFYNTRTLDKRLSVFWYSDGEDDPGWSAGFCVSKLEDLKISNLEKNYLINKLNRSNPNVIKKN